MFRTLFNVNINWKILLLLAIVFRVVFPYMGWYSYLALIFSFYQFFLLFYSIGHIIPVRYLFGSFMCLQMLIGPIIAYNFIESTDTASSIMKLSEDEYFLYVFPAVILFTLGLHIYAGNLKGEIVDQEKLILYLKKNKTLPYTLVGIGFIAGFLSQQFSSDLAFMFYLISGFKFMGVFCLIIKDAQLKAISIILVVGSIVASSLSSAMFQDLLTWIIMLATVFALKYKPTIFLKILFTVLFILLSFVIQQLKQGYRAATWNGGEVAGTETLSKIYEKEESNDLFSVKNIALMGSVRLNQGYIISNIMKTVPDKVPFSNGEELRQIIEAAIMPRILAPNKLTAGNREIFTKYSGIPLRPGTSMGLSSAGDAYINFGAIGGCIFMFFLGLLYNVILKSFNRHSKVFPILMLFMPLVFYYPIRPDCELQTALGHVVKSCFIIFIVFLFWKQKFIMPSIGQSIKLQPIVN